MIDLILVLAKQGTGYLLFGLALLVIRDRDRTIERMNLRIARMIVLKQEIHTTKKGSP